MWSIRYFCPILTTFCIARKDFHKRFQYQISQKSLQWEMRWWLSDRRTDGQTDITKCVGAFRVCANTCNVIWSVMRQPCYNGGRPFSDTIGIERELFSTRYHYRLEVSSATTHFRHWTLSWTNEIRFTPSQIIVWTLGFIFSLLCSPSDNFCSRPYEWYSKIRFPDYSLQQRPTHTSQCSTMPWTNITLKMGHGSLLTEKVQVSFQLYCLVASVLKECPLYPE